MTINLPSQNTDVQTFKNQVVEWMIAHAQALTGIVPIAGIVDLASGTLTTTEILLASILIELKTLNIHLASITEEEIHPGDIES
jgi:hypothetical protein